MAEPPLIVRVVTQGATNAAADLQGVASASGLVAKGAAAVAVGAAAAAAATVAWIDRTVDMIDQMDTLSKSSGLTLETINGLRFAARRAGKELKEVVPTDLAKKMARAASGSKRTAAAFGELGIGVEDLKALSPDEALSRVLDGLAAIENPGRRAALAFETMGEQGRNLLSTLEDSGGLENFVEMSRQFSRRGGPEAIEAMNQWREATAYLNNTTEVLSDKLLFMVGPISTKMKNFTRGLFFTATYIEELVKQSGDYAGAAQAAFETTLAWDQHNVLLAASAKKGGSSIKEMGKQARAAFPSVAEIRLEIARLRGDTKGAITFEMRIDLEKNLAQLRELRAAINAEPDPAEKAKLESVFRATIEQRAAIQEENQERFDELLRGEILAVQVAEEKKRQEYARTGRERMMGWLDQNATILNATAQGASIVASMATDLTAHLVQQYAERGKAARGAAMRAFRVNQAAAVLQIGIDSTVAGIAAWKLGPVVGPILASLIAVQGATASALVAAKQPNFHIGSRATDMRGDEYTATIRAGEGVVTPQAMEQIANLNAGLSGGSDFSGMALVLDHQTLGRFTASQLDGPVFARAMRRNRAAPLGRKR